MEPVPETRQALEAIGVAEGHDLTRTLEEMGRAAEIIVPDLVGLSVALVREQLTFTLVASNVSIGGVDATQYLGGRPCIRDDGSGEAVALGMKGPLSPWRWELFAPASLVSGIASSLSLPIIKAGEITGGVNLYASTRRAFSGRQELLAAALGATARGAVADADLSFDSRRQAALAPVRLRDRHDVDTATGLLAARHQESAAQAADRIAQAASRAGLPQPAVARVVLALHRHRL